MIAEGKKRAFLLGAAICCLTTALAGKPAKAQDADTDAALASGNDEADGNDQADIIVTARFKAESSQQVGAAISPFSAQMIEREGVVDFEDIVRRTPGLASTDRGPNTNEVLLRGIANQTTESVTDVTGVGPLVSQFLDDVPFSSSTASQRDVNLFDFERVEVLRGPQPTFFGEGSVGGTIRYISASPNLNGDPVSDLIFKGGLSSTSHGGLNWSANAAGTFNIVPDKLGVRLVFNSRHDDGFIDNPVRGVEDVNDFESIGGRAIVLFRPIPKLSFRLAAHLSRDKIDDLPYIDVGSRPSDLRLSTPIGGFSNDDIDLYSLKTEYAGDRVVLTSITGYYKRYRLTAGYDGANSLFFTSVLGAPINISLEVPFRDRTWTQEFRFVTDLPGIINFTGGLYYKNKRSEVVTELTSPDDSFDPFQAVPGDTIYRTSTTYKTRQYSGFVEATVKPIENLRLIGGARYVHERVNSIVNEFISVTGFAPPISTLDFATFLPASGLPTQFAFTLNKILPRAAVEYDISPTSLFYASVATGVRNGNLNAAVSAFQAAGGGTPAFDPQAFADYLVFDEDKVLTYEVGLKNQFLDGRLIANFAGYYTNYNNPQIFTATPFAFVTNGPDATIKGFEAETNFRLNRAVSLFGNLSYTDATFDESALLIPSLAPAITADVKAGNRLANVPEWAYAAGVNVNVPFGRLKLLGHLSYQYIGSRFTTAQNFVSAKLPSIGILNMRVGLEGANWSLVGYASNLTNEISPQAITATGGQAFVNAAGQLDAPVNAVSVNRPRTIGLELTFRY